MVSSHDSSYRLHLMWFYFDQSEIWFEYQLEISQVFLLLFFQFVICPRPLVRSCRAKSKISVEQQLQRGSIWEVSLRILPCLDSHEPLFPLGRPHLLQSSRRIQSRSRIYWWRNWPGRKRHGKVDGQKLPGIQQTGSAVSCFNFKYDNT